MPENWLGWTMFVFFAGGAVGGWLVVGAFTVDVYRGFKGIRKG